MEEQKTHVPLSEEFVVTAFVIKMIKGKVNPITCNEGTDWELRYGSTLFLTLVLGGMCWIHSDHVQEVDYWKDCEA